ncbi:MAG: hypothetical protein A2Z04_01995 [Chloroflexi bacterium RBG_16_57_9]|nr:MAG: hypothetical protein A2Z04_01995 [Chloroflexi bacterium RBG_16_57_9]
MAITVRFETLIDRYHDEIYRYLWRLLIGLGDAEGEVDAQDLTQEVFLRAFKAFGHLQPNSNHRAWLYKIATNCAYTVLKRNRRQSRHDVLSLDEARQLFTSANPSPHEQFVLNESLGIVRQAIAALPPKQQAAVMMRHIQGLEYPEIAQALGCSEDSARANVYQAIRRLRQELAEDWVE